MEEYKEAVDYALGADALFDINSRNPYVDCIVGECIDRYISERQQNFERTSSQGVVPINSKLEEAINKIFGRCITEKESKMVLGLAIDARRTDQVEISC